MLEKEELTDPEGNSHKGAAENAPLGTLNIMRRTHSFDLRTH